MIRRLNKRESDVLARFLEGFSCVEIATQLHDDPRVISYELNALRTKVRYHMRKLRNEDKTKPIASRRL